MDDNDVLKKLDTLKDDWRKMQIVIEADSDNLKMKALDKIKDIWIKVEIVKTMKSNDKKIEALDKIDDVRGKLNVILTFEDEDKIKAIDKIKSEQIKAKAIQSIKDIGMRLKLMYTLKSEKERLNVACSIEKYMPILKIIEKYNIRLKMHEIMPYVKNYANAEFVEKIYDLTEAEKIVMGSGLRKKEDRDRWIKERTKLDERIEEFSKKEYSKTELDLPEDMTFGVEIETEGIIYNKLKELIDRINIKESFFRKWKITYDCSLKCGAEFVSPVLNSYPDSLKQIEYIYNLIETIGLEVEESCGGHIHFGADYFGNDLKTWENFFNIWNESEELFYKMSNDVGEIPRDRLKRYAGNQSEGMKLFCEDGSIKIDSLKDIINLKEKISQDRYGGLNLSNLGNPKKNTIEFRIPNGPKNNKVQIENIKLFGKLLEVSKEMSNNKNLEEKLELFMNHDLSEKEKVEALLDLLFKEENDKEIYRARWDSVKEEKIFDDLFKSEDKNKYTFKRKDYSINNLTKNNMTKEEER